MCNWLQFEYFSFLFVIVLEYLSSLFVIVLEKYHLYLRRLVLAKCSCSYEVDCNVNIVQFVILTIIVLVKLQSAERVKLIAVYCCIYNCSCSCKVQLQV